MLVKGVPGLKADSGYVGLVIKFWKYGSKGLCSESYCVFVKLTNLNHIHFGTMELHFIITAGYLFSKVILFTLKLDIIAPCDVNVFCVLKLTKNSTSIVVARFCTIEGISCERFGWYSLWVGQLRKWTLITLMSQWPSWRLKSLANGLFFNFLFRLPTKKILSELASNAENVSN